MDDDSHVVEIYSHLLAPSVFRQLVIITSRISHAVALRDSYYVMCVCMYVCMYVCRYVCRYAFTLV